MDGVAINFNAWKEGQRSFPIAGVIAAGVNPSRFNKSTCVRIMTGAMLPLGADTVIPIENTVIARSKTTKQSNEIASLYTNSDARNDTVVQRGQYIRLKGDDARKGDVILHKGTRLTATQIGIAASFGKKTLRVGRLPRIAIIATGDELVDIHKPIKAYQTRLSNSYALEALLKDFSSVTKHHLPDNPKVLQTKIRQILSQCDICLLSGGVSMGEFDYIPKVLAQLKVKSLFHKVAQKPGKPFWFGITANNKAVFALPGNPISTLVCARRYVIPFIHKSLGIQNVLPFLNIVIGNPELVKNIKSDLIHFLPVHIINDKALLKGQVIKTGGSGDFSALANTDGFIEYDNTLKSNLRPYFSWRV